MEGRWWFFALSLSVLGCATNDSDQASSTGAAILEVEVQGTTIAGVQHVFAFQREQVAAGDTLTASVTLRNGGGVALPVGLAFAYASPAGGEPSPALRVASVELDDEPVGPLGGPWSATLRPLGDAGNSLIVHVEYVRPDDSAGRNATLSIGPGNGDEAVVIQFTSAGGPPVADAQPEVVDFGQVEPYESTERTLQISNFGLGPLLISEVLLKGHPFYSLRHKDTVVDAGERVMLDPPVEVPPAGSEAFAVRFLPLTNAPASGSVVFFTDDPTAPSGSAVELRANQGGPCIKISPVKVAFGATLVGAKAALPVAIESCGGTLEVHKLALISDSHPSFSLDHSTLPGFVENTKPSVATPLVVPVNTVAKFHVEYLTDAKNPPGPNGVPDLDVGHILIESNAAEHQVDVEVTGFGVEKSCPTAVLAIQEGLQVGFPTDLHLNAGHSFSAGGAVTAWEWKLVEGMAGTFVPSSTVESPTFTVPTQGYYTFSLDVWDESGKQSCVPATETVVSAIGIPPKDAIRVELTWHTPNDPDETDQGPEAGSDVDLHFTHDAYASSGPDIDKDGKPDGWFDTPFDCYWHNPTPNWGSFSTGFDDPWLKTIDEDGAGPEIVRLKAPENVLYRVGVHYWDDHGYGASYATLRVYIHENLVLEVSEVELVKGDMWDACVIEFPSGAVTPVESTGGGHKITPYGVHPFFEYLANEKE